MADDLLKTQLPRWMRAIELEPSGSRLGAFESSANQLGTTLSGRDVLDMTLLAYGRSHGDAFDHLSRSIREHDPTFGCRADDLESSVAAGAAIAAVLMNESKSSSVAAQGVLSAEWKGLSTKAADLPKLAATTVRRRSETLRMRHPLPSLPSTDLFREFLEQVTKSEPDESPLYSEVELLGKAAKDAIKELHTSQHVMADRLNAADEELEVLWWAFSGYSELAREKWSDLAPETAALLCGVELANKLAFEIELPSTEALLARLLGPNTKERILLGNAVEATADFLRSMDVTDGHPLLPIVSSISEHRALSGKLSWKGSVDRWNIDPEHSTEKLALACQAVRERVLMGNISDG